MFCLYAFEALPYFCKVPHVLLSCNKATVFLCYNTVWCIHLEVMGRNVSYLQCGKVWCSCSQSFV